MNFLKKWLRPSKDESEKKKVCWLVLGKMLGYMLVMADEEQNKLGGLNGHDPEFYLK